MDGRLVAKPGEKSENPGIELSPEAIRMVMDNDPDTLIKLADALHDAGIKALAAIDAKNADALSDAGEVIDNACENCHLKYWYPADAEKVEARGQREKEMTHRVRARTRRRWRWQSRRRWPWRLPRPTRQARSRAA